MLFYLTTRSCDTPPPPFYYIFIYFYLGTFLVNCFPQFMVILWDEIVYCDVIMVVARPCEFVVLLDNKVTWLFYYLFIIIFMKIWGDSLVYVFDMAFYLCVITFLHIVLHPWLLHLHVSLLSMVYICKQTLLYHWQRSYDRKFWFLPLYYFTLESNFVFIHI